MYSVEGDPTDRPAATRTKESPSGPIASLVIQQSLLFLSLRVLQHSFKQIMDALFKFHLKKRRRKGGLLRALLALVVILQFRSNFYPPTDQLALLCSAQQQQENSNQNQQAELSSSPPFAFFDEPQPFVYMALNFDSGSGDGYAAREAAESSSELSNKLNSLDQSSSISPSLIAANCWNNYLLDSTECRKFNVITAGNEPQSNQNMRFEDDDSLITPVVIFEASSPLEVPAGESSSPANAHLAPPYFTSTAAPDSSNVVHRIMPGAIDVIATSPESTINPSRPTPRPASRIHIATPRPSSSLTTLQSPSKSSTTQGRKCRDENDDDCDEPEEVKQTKMGSAGESDNDDEDEDDTDDEPSESSSSSNKPGQSADRQANSEFGSGVGPTDDNDGGDDADDNLDETSGISEAPTELTTRYLEVSTRTAPISSQRPELGTVQSQTLNPLPVSTQRAPVASTTARIEVVVHSTLPPSFPITTSGRIPAETESEPPSKQADLADPNDTFTSLPVFPPSSSTTNMADRTDEGAGQTESDRAAVSDVDLATFKAIPFSLGDNHRKPPSVLSSASNESDIRSQTVEPTELTDTQRINPSPSRFENPWQHSSSTRPPIMRPPSPSELPMRFAPGQSSEVTTRAGSDMLPQMLLYASIVILIVTALIFILMAFTLWRRNGARQRALLQKSQILGGHNGQMVASLSHASQLLPPGAGLGIASVPRQPGLLSTYAPGKGMTVGKVTTSLIKSSNDNLMINDEEEDERLMARSKDQLALDGPQQARQANGVSWSNSTTTTTTTSNSHSSSQRTEGSQQGNSNGLHANGQLRAHHSNSLSDGRQNSSSISDSQESPETGISQTVNAPYVSDPNNSVQMQPAASYVPLEPFDQYKLQMQQAPPVFYNERPWPNQYGPPGPENDSYQRGQPSMIQTCSFPPSRSMEDIHREPGANMSQDWHKGNNPPYQQPLLHKAPHAGRIPQHQRMVYPVHDASLYSYNPAAQANLIAANPLATMARGGYVGAYNPNNGSSTINYNSGPPPVIGRKDRSEAWYV